MDYFYDVYLSFLKAKAVMNCFCFCSSFCTSLWIKVSAKCINVNCMKTGVKFRACLSKESIFSNSKAELARNSSMFVISHVWPANSVDSRSQGLNVC